MTDPINLLFITTYVGLGGGETSLLTLVESLVKREPRYRPHLLLPHDGQLGERWRANFFKCAENSKHPHWASWSPIGPILKFHQPNRFGELYFKRMT